MNPVPTTAQIDTADWWCEHAWLADGQVASGVRIGVVAGRIASVETDAEADGATRLPGLVVPGLANAHSHAFHRALRTRTQTKSGSFWTWRDLMYRVADRLDPDLYRALARAVYAEMALAGITAVGEFHYLHHEAGGRRYRDPNAMGHALVQAALDAGTRLTVLDACYLTAAPDGAPLASGPQERFGDGDAETWAERVAAFAAAATEPGIRVGAAVHSVRAVPANQMPTVAAWAREAGAPLHVHAAEQRAEIDQCLATYDRTPIAVLRDHGVLGAQTTLVHATHLTESDIAVIHDTATGVCFCPTTERDLGDGVGPAPQLLAGPGLFCLGSDSHAVIDLFEEARAVELNDRLVTGRRATIGSARLLRAATDDGHRSLGWSDAGRLERGARADLVAVDLGSVRTAGGEPGSDTVVFAATGADVTHVVADGRPIVADRRHLLIDDPAAELGDAIAELLQTPRRDLAEVS